MNNSFLDFKTNPITVFTRDDKRNYLKDPDAIDRGIRELVDAVNAVDVFFTMNSCQGFLVEDERDDHCPETYVDFYVIDGQYPIARMLLASLTSRFNVLVNCKVVYEADYDFVSEDEVKANGAVKLRHSIELFELPPDLLKTTYRDLVDHIRRFAEWVNKMD